jgi:hypothetical protein
VAERLLRSRVSHLLQLLRQRTSQEILSHIAICPRVLAGDVARPLSRADTSDDLKGASMPSQRSMGCSCNRAGRELSFTVWSRRSFRLTAAERRVRIDGPPVMLEPNTAQAIAISLHELATNAAILISIGNGWSC